MTTKRQKLNLLRQKVSIMQQNLHSLQKQTRRKDSTPELLKPLNKITLIKGKRKFSQTQRNFSLTYRQHDTFFTKEQSKGQLERHNLKMNTQRNLSNVLKDIVNRIEQEYYISKPTLNDTFSIETEDQQKQFYQTTGRGRRYAHNDFAMTRGESPRASKLRTFDLKKTDTIVNPERPKESSIKIVKMLQKSSNQMFAQNPRSNPKLYIINDHAVYMTRKGSMGNKNQSSLINSKSKGQLLPSYTANSLEKTSRSQKKHFEKYVKEYYSPRPHVNHNTLR